MTGVAFVASMAAREIRASARRLLLLTGSVTIGVAALVAVGSFADNLRDSVRSQAQALLGADLSLSARRPLTPRTEALLDTLLREGASVARVTSFSGMAYVPRTAGTRLVQVAAVDGGYPFYGAIRTAPASAWSGLGGGHRIVADPALLTALAARVGDTLALGDGRFEITGTIVSAPGNTGLRAAFGPRVFIAARNLPGTRLLGVASRAEYEVFLKLPSSLTPERLAERYRPALRVERVRVRTVAEDQEGLDDALSRLTGYLGLVGLIALLLGGVGVASAVVVFVRQRLDTVAVLRCLGATSGQVLAVYLAEAAIMGLGGGVLGAALGTALQQLLPGLLSGFLPVDVRVSLSWSAILLGIGEGLWVALVFALLPLLAVRRVPPLAALRRDVEPLPLGRDRWRPVAAVALGASLVALARLQVGTWRQAGFFALGAGVAVLLLWLGARLLVRVARRRLPGGWSYPWRQGLANLHRPANQTATVVLAIGFAGFLLATLLVAQATLLRRLRLTGGPARPNLALFDIQQDQLRTAERELRDAGLPSSGAVPIVPMRIQSIKGRTVAQILADSARGGPGGEEPSNAWAYRREYRSTYRDTLVSSEKLVAGRWATSAAAGPSVSVESGLARELGVTVGDEIVWDVQGLPVRTRVGSLRDVEWARFEPNFFVVFRSGVLEQAPQTFVLLTRIERADQRGSFQRRLAERLPNVSTLDLSALQETLERLLGRVVLAIRFMALFTLATGALVLVGALATSRYQRIREGALLRTLGATRGQLLRILLAEYAAMGLLAALLALVMGALAGWALSRFLFDARLAVPVAPVAALAAGVVGLPVLIGLGGSREVVRRPPLEVLRTE
jgi:putative ABC transport system permease protein